VTLPFSDFVGVFVRSPRFKKVWRIADTLLTSFQLVGATSTNEVDSFIELFQSTLE